LVINVYINLLSSWTQNLPAYRRNLLPPSPNPDDRAGMLIRNDGKFLTTIWRHIPRHCNLQAVFCPRFVLYQSCARDTIVSYNCTS